MRGRYYALSRTDDKYDMVHSCGFVIKSGISRRACWWTPGNDRHKCLPVSSILIQAMPDPEPEPIHRQSLLRVCMGYAAFMGIVVAVLYILCQVFLPIKQ